MSITTLEHLMAVAHFIIAAVTSKTDVTSVIKRVSVSAKEIAAVGRINIKQFIS